MNNKNKIVISVVAVIAVIAVATAFYFGKKAKIIAPEEQAKVIQNSLQKIDDLQARVDAGEVFTADEIQKQTDELNALQSQITEIEKMMKKVESTTTASEAK